MVEHELERFTEWDACSKDLQNGMPDGRTFLVLLDCEMKKLQGMCLRQPLGDRLKFVQECDVGSRVSFSDPIETGAVIRLRG